MALRNRKELEEFHLKGVMRPTQADPTKLQLGTCEELQNTIQGGINSWQKKRGPKWLDGIAPQTVFLGTIGLACSLDTIIDPQALVGTYLYDMRDGISGVPASPTGFDDAFVSWGSFGKVDVGTHNIKAYGSQSSDVFNETYGSDHHYTIQFANEDMADAVRLTDYLGSGHPTVGVTGAYACLLLGDEEGFMLYIGGTSMSYCKISTPVWTTLTVGVNEGNPDGSRWFKDGSNFIGISFFATGNGADGVHQDMWQFTNSTEDHHIQPPHKVASACFSDTYFVTVDVNGDLIRYAKNDITSVHDTTAITGLTDGCRGIVSVSDDKFYIVISDSNTKAEVWFLDLTPMATLKTIIDSDITVTPGTCTDPHGVAYLVDGYIFWAYQAPNTNTPFKVIKIGPLNCPSS